MNIAVVGTGYVGLICGVCFANAGNKVTCVDVDKQKIERLRKGDLPIYEPDLIYGFSKNIQHGHLKFSTDLSKSIQGVDFVFIAVGTPMGADGSADLKSVLTVAEQVGKYMQHPLIVVSKSTVPVGTCDRINDVIKRALSNRGVDFEFQVVSNPEFLKEGNAVDDFLRPDRIVIGSHCEKATAKMKKLYQPFVSEDKICAMSVRSAEMTKYAANAMLATKISFINEIANLCERVGADVNQVRHGIGSDTRIGLHFINAGIGYGGSCFPKDVRALQRIGQTVDYEMDLINAVETVNNRQKLILLDKITHFFGDDLKGKTFAFWGLAFKPNTDDMREAPAIYMAKALSNMGAKIHCYDPEAMEQAKGCYLKGFSDVSYFDEPYQALQHADALLLLTEWGIFKNADLKQIKERLKTPVIFDGRNQYDFQELKKEGITYYCIGRSHEK